MGIAFVKHAQKSDETKVVTPSAVPQQTPYRVAAKPVSADYLNGPGRLRVQHLMFLYGCSQSAVYRKIKDGHMPPPSGADPRKYWSNEVVRKHLTTGEMPIKAGGVK
jgi:hypothetical protein